MKRIVKLVVATAVGLAVIVVAPTPSPAMVASVDGGTITTNTTPPTTVGYCPTPTASFTSTSATTATATLQFSTPFQIGIDWFTLTATLSGTATLTGTSLTLSLTGSSSIRAGFCPSASSICSVPSLSLTLTGTYEGVFTPDMLGEATLAGTSGAISFTGCSTTLAPLNGKDFSISGLQATFGILGFTDGLSLPTGLAASTAPCPTAPGATLSLVSTGATTANATLSLPGVDVRAGTAIGFLVATLTGTATLSGSDLTVNLAVANGTIKRETSPGNCTMGTLNYCASISITSMTLTGTFSGTFTPTVSGSVVSLDGSGNVAAAGCAPPFSGLNGDQMFIQDLSATL